MGISILTTQYYGGIHTWAGKSVQINEYIVNWECTHHDELAVVTNQTLQHVDIFDIVLTSSTMR